MKRRIAIRSCVAVIAIAARLPGQTTAPDAGAIVSKAARVYRALSAFQADFRMRIDDPLIGDPITSRGTIYQMGTSRFAMRFTDPPKDLIVIDGTQVLVYLPSSSPGQVLKYPMPSGQVYGYNLLGWLMDRPLDRYRATYKITETIDGHRTDAIVLEPTGTDVNFRRATIWFDRESSLPRRVQLDEKPRGGRLIDLSNLRPNASISAATFTFEPPSGVKVIEQE